jgi:predicted XRE-type DNA-binding protein
MKTKANRPEHVTRGNVLDDLGFSPEEAAVLKVKADLMIAIQKVVRKKKYSQRRLTEILDEHQPVISNLLRGNISQMSIEKLLRYARRLGLKTRVTVQSPRQAQKTAA